MNCQRHKTTELVDGVCPECGWTMVKPNPSIHKPIIDTTDYPKGKKSLLEKLRIKGKK